MPEYAVAAERYFGNEQGQAWIAQFGAMVSTMVRIAITPEWDNAQLPRNKAKRRSRRIFCKLLKRLVAARGLEPRTYGL